MTSHINYTSSFATKQRSKAASSFVGMATTTNKQTIKIMKEIEIVGATTKFAVPEHVQLKAEKAHLIKGVQVFSVDAITAESYTARENRLSLTPFEEYTDIEGNKKPSITVNAMSLMKALKPILPKYRKLTKVLVNCRTIQGKSLFNMNKMSNKELALFGSFLTFATFDVIQVSIKAGSPKWDNAEESYDEDAIHNEFTNIKWGDDSEIAADLQQAYNDYLKEEKEKAAAEAAAEAATPLPEL